MLATPWPEPFSDQGWLFEQKLDGFRSLLYWDGKAIVLRSRRGNDVTASYPELGGLAPDRPCVIDGELVVLDASGRSSFELMQQRMGAPRKDRIERFPVTFVAFDALYDDREIVGRPIEYRLERLDPLVADTSIGRCETVIGDGMGLWRSVIGRGQEGIVAKRLGTPYLPGKRSDHWRKISRVLRVRAVVGGFTPGHGARAGAFGSLLVGLRSHEGLRWIGSVGTGFGADALRAIRAALDEMRSDRCPFLSHPELPTESVWVEPQLVAMVGYKEWTSAGRLRAPRFVGFTDDDPLSVTWEAEGPRPERENSP